MQINRSFIKSNSSYKYTFKCYSHVSLLIKLGFSVTAIADRVGHKAIGITYGYAHLFPSKQKEMALSLTQVRNNKANDWKDLLEEDDKDV